MATWYLETPDGFPIGLVDAETASEALEDPALDDLACHMGTDLAQIRSYEPVVVGRAVEDDDGRWFWLVDKPKPRVLASDAGEDEKDHWVRDHYLESTIAILPRELDEERILNAAVDWLEHEMHGREVAEWLRAGVHASGASYAAELGARGWKPSQLCTLFDGWPLATAYCQGIITLDQLETLMRTRKPIPT